MLITPKEAAKIEENRAAAAKKRAALESSEIVDMGPTGASSPRSGRRGSNRRGSGSGGLGFSAGSVNSSRSMDIGGGGEERGGEGEEEERGGEGEGEGGGAGGGAGGGGGGGGGKGEEGAKRGRSLITEKEAAKIEENRIKAKKKQLTLSIIENSGASGNSKHSRRGTSPRMSIQGGKLMFQFESEFLNLKRAAKIEEEEKEEKEEEMKAAEREMDEAVPAAVSYQAQIGKKKRSNSVSSSGSSPEQATRRPYNTVGSPPKGGSFFLAAAATSRPPPVKSTGEGGGRDGMPLSPSPASTPKRKVSFSGGRDKLEKIDPARQEAAAGGALGKESVSAPSEGAGGDAVTPMRPIGARNNARATTVRGRRISNLLNSATKVIRALNKPPSPPPPPWQQAGAAGESGDDSGEGESGGKGQGEQRAPSPTAETEESTLKGGNL